jgi:hypothetical protein
MTPFEKDIGTGNGRVSAEMTDSYAFELGSSARGDGYFNENDYNEVSQTGVEFDLQTMLIRVDANVRLPETGPTAYEWELSGWLNSAKMYSRRLRPESRELAVRDIAISTKDAITGPNNTIKFRLQVVAA